jgi:DNA adenine methylase
VAPEVWTRFGQVGHYCEPFLGGAAILLGRPEPRGLETVNDLDGLLVNFWRSLKMRPEAVAHHAFFPPSDADLQARHRWLREQRGAIDAGLEDPTWCNPLAAAWWAWGQAHAYQQRWVERTGRPVLAATPASLLRPEAGELLTGLAQRLQRVVLLRRDWTTVVRESMLFRGKQKAVGVFLDPPYEGDEGCYAPQASVAGAVWDWALEHGEDARLRIAVCGYEDGRQLPAGWTSLAWTSRGSGARRDKERIWFSPHCLLSTG